MIFRNKLGYNLNAPTIKWSAIEKQCLTASFKHRPLSNFTTGFGRVTKLMNSGKSQDPHALATHSCILQRYHLSSASIISLNPMESHSSHWKWDATCQSDPVCQAQPDASPDSMWMLWHRNKGDGEPCGWRRLNTPKEAGMRYEWDWEMDTLLVVTLLTIVMIWWPLIQKESCATSCINVREGPARETALQPASQLQVIGFNRAGSGDWSPVCKAWNALPLHKPAFSITNHCLLLNPTIPHGLSHLCICLVL